MTGIKTIALAGVGNLGNYFVEHLTAEKKAGRLTEVIVLSRAVRPASPCLILHNLTIV